MMEIHQRSKVSGAAAGYMFQQNEPWTDRTREASARGCSNKTNLDRPDPGGKRQGKETASFSGHQKQHRECTDRRSLETWHYRILELGKWLEPHISTQRNVGSVRIWIPTPCPDVTKSLLETLCCLTLMLILCFPSQTTFPSPPQPPLQLLRLQGLPKEESSLLSSSAHKVSCIWQHRPLHSNSASASGLELQTASPSTPARECLSLFEPYSGFPKRAQNGFLTVLSIHTGRAICPAPFPVSQSILQQVLSGLTPPIGVVQTLIPYLH